MVKAPDFDRKMLLLATQLAHETKQKTLLLAILGAMLRTLQQGTHLGAETEGIMIVRCSVRIILDLLKEPLAVMYVPSGDYRNRGVFLLGGIIQERVTQIAY
jgi:hypothetical protein